MEQFTDVAVVGTGLLGLATAFEAVGRGLNVTLIGPRAGSHHGQATRAAGAMLTVFSEVEAAHPAERVALEVGHRVAARRMYEGWLEAVNTAGMANVGLTPGVWVLANGYGADDNAELAAIAAAARAHEATAEFADAADVPGLSPQVRAHRALWLPDEASLDPIALTEALSAALTTDSRCSWVDATATEITEVGQHLCVGTLGGNTVLAAHVVLAAGVVSGKLLAEPLRRQAAMPVLHSGRGVSAVARAPFPLPHAVRTPNRGFACGSHMVPRRDLVYVGATNRLSTDPDPSVPATFDELSTLIHDAAVELHTDLRRAHLVQVRVGHRPVTLDHLPVIGPTGHPMIHAVTGTYRCGILLAPHLATLVVNAITEPGSLTEHPYRATRPMPTLALEDVIGPAVPGLVEMICQPGGTLPPAGQDLLIRYLEASLRELADGASPRAAAVRRLWARAPIAECLPLILDTAGRMR